MNKTKTKEAAIKGMVAVMVAPSAAILGMVAATAHLNGWFGGLWAAAVLVGTASAVVAIRQAVERWTAEATTAVVAGSVFAVCEWPMVVTIAAMAATTVLSGAVCWLAASEAEEDDETYPAAAASEAEEDDDDDALFTGAEF